MLSIRRQQTQRLNGDVEVASVSVFSDASAERNEVGSGYVGGSLDERLADVIDLVLVKSEAVATKVGVGTFVGGILNDVLEVVADEFEELFEHCGCLCLVQGSHLCLKWKE